MAVSGRSDDNFSAYVTAGARPVFDDHLLAEPLR
jgi:hypothetical protein